MAGRDIICLVNSRRRKRLGSIKTRSYTKGHKADYILLGLTLLLTLLGIISVADSSSPHALKVFDDPYYFAKQQLMWSGVGFVGMISAYIFNYKIWKKLAFPLFFISLCLLFLIFIPGFSSETLGARRWLSIGGIGFQPAEIMKLVLAIIIAKLLSENYYYIYPIGVTGLVAGGLLLQPDFGTTLVILSISFVQLFVGGIPLLYVLGLGFLGGVGSLAIVVFSDYRRARLLTFLNLGRDPLGASYHIRQILIALGSGGLFGVGLGHSKQKHLFLPETATDSVFAVMGEELGFVGASFIIILLTYFVLRIFKIASQAPDKFSQTLVSGIATWFAAQIFLNLASMVALTPITGIPLPFFSYGGSSLTMILISIGIILNISRFNETK